MRIDAQGFTADVVYDRAVWAGYIKDYEGGTIMHASAIYAWI
jgi:histone acetyltransferase